jgi:dTDP-glucose pyrophosphorylase
MKNISYLICAAGEGSRLRDVSPHRSKTLLKLRGKTLLEHSLKSLPLRTGDEIVFLHRLAGDDFSRAQAVLEKFSRYGRIVPLGLDRLTSGQAETAYHARTVISHSRIAIYNTDTSFRSRDLKIALHQHDFDGVAPCYKAPGESWSFFKTVDDGPFFKATDVQEKKRISDWCSTGFYYFKDADLFFSEVAGILERGPQKQELYVAPLYARWIAAGRDVRVVDCEEFKPMGTPEQVQAFWNVSMTEFKNENA